MTSSALSGIVIVMGSDLDFRVRRVQILRRRDQCDSHYLRSSSQSTSTFRGFLARHYTALAVRELRGPCHGSPASHSRSWCFEPRHVARECASADLRRRRRLRALPPPTLDHTGAIRRTVSRLLPCAKPFPPAASGQRPSALA